MASKGFFQLQAKFEGSGVIVDVPKFNGLMQLDDNLRRACFELGLPFPKRGVTPSGFYLKCTSPEEMQALWTVLEPKLLDAGHRGTLRLHFLAGKSLPNDPEAYDKVMALFDRASPLDPRFDRDAPVLTDDPDHTLG